MNKSSHPSRSIKDMLNGKWKSEMCQPNQGNSKDVPQIHLHIMERDRGSNNNLEPPKGIMLIWWTNIREKDISYIMSYVWLWNKEGDHLRWDDIWISKWYHCYVLEFLAPRQVFVWLDQNAHGWHSVLPNHFYNTDICLVHIKRMAIIWYTINTHLV